jgi:hypothetical protein
MFVATNEFRCDVQRKPIKYRYDEIDIRRPAILTMSAAQSLVDTYQILKIDGLANHGIQKEGRSL